MYRLKKQIDYAKFTENSIVNLDIDYAERLLLELTFEQIKKEWEKLGYKVKVDNYPNAIIIRGSSNYEDNIIYLFLKSKTISFGEYSRFSIKEHQLLTKTFKALGWM